MKVTNRTAHAIIAFGLHIQRGYGKDVRIEPGETKDVSGPYLGVMDGGECHIHLEGDIVCHSGPDDDTCFQVLKGKPLCLQSEDLGVTVRHHEDEPEPHVKEWRASGACTPSAMKQSYCLDVTVGYDESYREKLIDFLKRTGQSFEIGKVQRGMWQGTKILRIETPKAEALRQHIYEWFLIGGDNDYVIHDTYIDAQRSDTWLPDLDTCHNAEPFILMETATT